MIELMDVLDVDDNEMDGDFEDLEANADGVIQDVLASFNEKTMTDEELRAYHAKKKAENRHNNVDDGEEEEGGDKKDGNK